MKVSRIEIKNFRGISSAIVYFPKHTVLIGDNNTGKTTILEALDLVLGPDRLSRVPSIDEHDFFQGNYLVKVPSEGGDKSADNGQGGQADGGHASDSAAVGMATQPSTEFGKDESMKTAQADAVPASEAAIDMQSEVQPIIEIEVIVSDLNDQQKGVFGDYIEFWDDEAKTLYDNPEPAGVDASTINEALRVTFRGRYDSEEDDFEGKTFFTRSLSESDKPEYFSKKHKQICGFLYLRSIRTGSRALSLERGSLLDIILRLKEVRPQMWEDTIGLLSGFSVASDPKLGISGVLESINTSLKKYVPKEWGIEPHLKVSSLTRDHLRKVITAFIATGETNHSAPFYRQGTGTINMLVLAMLSQIAEGKQNVIFAMEEPETAIPPYAQKRIIHEIRKLASQAIFTSHSPYVIEEFSLDETLVLGRSADGVLCQRDIALPDSVKPKRYRQEFRTRFCEGLLARRILIAEGATETTAFSVVCRRLSELNTETYSSLEALGICIIDAGGETNIPDMARLYRELDKRTFAICDKQSDESKALIETEVELLLMHSEKGFEDLVLLNTTNEALRRFAHVIDWPQHLTTKYPNPENDPLNALRDYFGWTKANWGVADFLAQCEESEIPQWLRDACIALKDICEPKAEAGSDTGNEGGADAATVISAVAANGLGINAAQ